MSLGHFKDHWTLALCIVDARLTAEMRFGHLGCLETHQAEGFGQTNYPEGQVSSEDGERDFTSYGPANSSLREVHLKMNGAGSYSQVLDRLPLLDT